MSIKSDMIFEFDMPDKCRGEILDTYLENGWFRDGSLMSRYELIHFREDIYSVAPLRSELEYFDFSKSQRKLLKKNSHFDTLIRPITFNERKEEMYQIHRDRFKSNNSPKTLKNYFIEEGNRSSPFDTWELEVYDNGQLVGVSFFDVADKSLCSILAIFDPLYEKQSLGITTMLLEVEYAMSIGKSYYYPGYILDEPSVFDYKKRLKALQYYNWKEDSWLDLEELNTKPTAKKILNYKLSSLTELINAFPDMQAERIENEQFFYHVWHCTFDLADVVPAPIYLEVVTKWGHRLNIQYNLKDDSYILTLHHYYGFFYQTSRVDEIAHNLRQTYLQLSEAAELQHQRLHDLKLYLGNTAKEVQYFSNGNKAAGFIEMCIEGRYLTFYITYLHTSNKYEVHASNGTRDIFVNSFDSIEGVSGALILWFNKRTLAQV